MTNIVIVGAGFGGLQSALNLQKKFHGNKGIQLTLVDKRDYHLFTPNLYEVASSEEELTTLAQMEQSITLPLPGFLAKKGIKFIQGEVTEIFSKEKKLALAGRQTSYDYLILALGSCSDFFHIEGAQKFALPLKTLADAFRIRNQIEFAVEAQKFDVNKKTLRLVVAGGGYTGVELAAELKGLLDFLSWKYQYPREKMEIEIIEASNKLILGFNDRLSDDAYDRLQELGVHVRLGSRISDVDQHFVDILGGERIAYDVLVWTTGVRANEMKCEAGNQLLLDAKGKLSVNEFLQAQGHQDIFALGDVACVTDSKGHAAPASAQDAWDQAKYLSYALPYIMKNQKPPRAYAPKSHGFIVSLGGKWAIACFKHFYIKGFGGWFTNQLAHMRYYATVVGWWKALGYIVFQVEMYGRND